VSPLGPPEVSVGVVALFGAAPLAGCLRALAEQTREPGAPRCELVVAYDPALADVPPLAAQFPGVRFVASEGRAPTEVAAAAVAEARAPIVLLTEDHCLPAPGWVRALQTALEAPERAVVGGVMDTDSAAPATDFALFLVEFFRYLPPGREGPAPTLTVCNAGYRRAQLDAIAPVGRGRFHETEVHDALRARFGALWLVPAARVRMRRRVRLRDAAGERYAFGRLFGCTRRAALAPAARLVYALAALALPVLLAARLARAVLARPALRRASLRALPASAVLLVAWSLGESLGVLTGRYPGATAAPDAAAPVHRR
jgi:hypothetical protein